jgi:hypothetical protein
VPTRAVGADRDLAGERAFPDLALERRTAEAGAIQNCSQSDHPVGFIGHIFSNPQAIGAALG